MVLIKTGVGVLVREGTPMLTVVHDTQETNGNDGDQRSLLDEIVRDGARQMLAAALQAEVAAYVAQFADQLDEDGHRLVVRNGYHQAREVLTAAGAVEVKAPRVNDKRVDPDTGERKRFSSAILPALAREAPQMSEVLPLLYLHLKETHLQDPLKLNHLPLFENSIRLPVFLEQFLLDMGYMKYTNLDFLKYFFELHQEGQYYSTPFQYKIYNIYFYWLNFSYVQ